METKKMIKYLMAWLAIGIVKHASAQNFTTLEVQRISSGMTHYTVQEPNVPWMIHVIEADLTQAGVSIETVKPKASANGHYRLQGKKTVSSMSSDISNSSHQVITAINGDFFSSDGLTSNTQVIKGEILRKPYPGRGLFAYRGPTDYSISSTRYQGKVILKNTVYDIDNVNNIPSRGRNDLVYYNHYYGSTTSTSTNATELVLRAIDRRQVNTGVRAIVQAKSHGGNSRITETTFVLSGYGEMAGNLNSVAVGDTLAIEHRLLPDTGMDWSSTRPIQEVIGGKERILAHGEIVGGWDEETYFYKRHPRSAIGYNADKTKLFLVTVDGRQPSFSKGMTLTEFGNYMKTLGIHTALNLDGGGSTTLVVNNNVVNSPSDGTGERAVGNASDDYSANGYCRSFREGS